VRLDDPDRPLLLFQGVVLIVLGSLLIGGPGAVLSQWVGGAAALIGGFLLAAWYERRDDVVDGGQP